MQPVLLMLVGALVALAVMAGVLRLAGFRGQRPGNYVRTAPQFDLREHLAGAILCEGMIYGPTGRVVSRFVADMDGEWNGARGVMREIFRYDSGTVQRREWRLTLGDGGAVRAEADDLVGVGRGQQEGAAMRLEYRIRMPEGAGGYVLDVTDWMYLLENGTVMNRSQFRKYGIKVAELVATMRKKDLEGVGAGQAVLDRRGQ